jgi:IS1 family transposase
MNKLSHADRAQVVRCLVDGNSIRATVRITDVAKNTIAKLVVELGRACAAFQNKTLVGLKTTRIEADETWSFVGMKEKNVPAPRREEFGIGDVWTWVAIDADSKLVVSWLVGERDTDTAVEFMNDVATRIGSERVQITTDGLKCYLVAVPKAFGARADFAQLVKTYGLMDVEGQRRYSPAVCTGSEKEMVCGTPDESKVSTSYVERQNLTMRTGMRRFTRLTNGFSKKIENHCAAVALHFAHYNFCRGHKTLGGKTPAMVAGLTDRVWSVEELLALVLAN